MADKTHIVEEKIKFTTEGVEPALNDIVLLEGALQSLEDTKITAASISTDDVKRLRAMREEMEKMEGLGRKSVQAQEKGTKASKEAKDSSGGIFKIWEGLRRSGPMQFFFGLASVIMRGLNGVTQMNRQMAQMAATSGKLDQMFSAGGGGRDQLTGMSMKITTLAGQLHTTPDKVLAVSSAFLDAGLSIDQFSGRLEAGTQSFDDLAVSAMDMSYRVYGSLDKMGDVVAHQSELMDKFGMTAGGASDELRYLGIDAHQSSMATSRFVGAVRDISGELDMYGGSVKTVSGLLGEFGKTTGAARAIQEAKTLTTSLNNMSDAQRSLVVKAAGGIPQLRNVLEAQMEAAAKALREAESGTDAEATKIAKDRVERIRMAIEGISGGVVSPYAVSEATRAAGTKAQLIMGVKAAIQALTPGERGAGGLSNLGGVQNKAVMGKILESMGVAGEGQGYDYLFRLIRMQQEEAVRPLKEGETRKTLMQLMEGLDVADLDEAARQQKEARERVEKLNLAMETLTEKGLRFTEQAAIKLGLSLDKLNGYVNAAVLFFDKYFGDKPSTTGGGVAQSGARDILEGNFLKGLVKLNVGGGLKAVEDSFSLLEGVVEKMTGIPVGVQAIGAQALRNQALQNIPQGQEVGGKVARGALQFLTQGWWGVLRGAISDGVRLGVDGSTLNVENNDRKGKVKTRR